MGHTLGRIGMWAIGVVAVVALAAVIAVRLPPVQQWAANLVVRRLPPGMHAGDVTLSLLPPGLRLDDVALSPDGPTVATVIAEPRLGALLAGRLELRRLSATGAAITIDRTRGAPSNPTTALGSAAAAARPGAQPFAFKEWPAIAVEDVSLTLIDRTPPGAPRTLAIRNLALTLGEATGGASPLALTADLVPSGRIEATGTVTAAGGDGPVIEARATAQALDAATLLGYLAGLLPAGTAVQATGSVDGSLAGRWAMDGDATGELDLLLTEGDVLWDEVRARAPMRGSARVLAAGDTLALEDGRLTIARLAAAPVEATELTAELAFRPPTLHIARASARAFGGTWTQRGTVVLGDPPRYDVRVTAEGIACHALLGALGGTPSEFDCARLDSEAEVRGPWTGARTVAQRAEGTGRVDLRGGTFPSATVLGAIWDALQPLVRTGGRGDVLDAPTTIDRLTETFTLRSGLMHTRDLRLVTGDFTLTAAGTISLAGALDLDADIAMTPDGMARLLTVAALPVPRAPGTLPAVPARITGTLAEPVVRPDVRHLPRAVLGSLFTGMRGAGELLDGAAGSGLRELERRLLGDR